MIAVFVIFDVESIKRAHGNEKNHEAFGERKSRGRKMLGNI